MKQRKRVTYRPSKASGIFGFVWSGIFVLIGLFVAIPIFGAFGLLWTVLALAMTIYQGYLAFGKKYVGPEIHIEEESAPEEDPAGETHDHIPSMALNAKARLEQLKTLREAGLITDQEYAQKRKEILEEM